MLLMINGMNLPRRGADARRSSAASGIWTVPSGVSRIVNGLPSTTVACTLAVYRKTR
ncbi:MAG: hypothetical protein OEN20_05655 [Gammaproteobacteria bacterium]|nr:hypothetical protein [Gammaproteobacteria bacterium]